MDNGNPENFRNPPYSRSVDPNQSRRRLNKSSQDPNQDKSEKSEHSGNKSTNKASDLFNFKEVGVFVRKKQLKTKSFGSVHSNKHSNSNKSSLHSISKHSDESSDKPDRRHTAKQDSSDSSNKTANEDSNSQNASYQNVLSDLKPHHQTKKSVDAVLGRNSPESMLSKAVLPANYNNSQQVFLKNETVSGIVLSEPRSKTECNEPVDKSSPLMKEKRIAIPMASKIVNEEVIQRIKNKVSSTTQNNNQNQFSFSNSFLSEFMASKAKEKKSGVSSVLQEESKESSHRIGTLVFFFNICREYRLLSLFFLTITLSSFCWKE